MSKITPEALKHLAKLARLELTEAELATYATQLDIILDSVDKIREVAAQDVKPMSHAVGLTNVFREDAVKPSLNREEVLAQAPAQEANRFRVPRILNEE
ncbi:MAG: Asp-tRNA(Asn)/Glu-tRNA(Gln) amidotransferase subunit GatC [Candidatus Nanopelagicales bacterium]